MVDFIDRVKIYVKGGKGGNGAIAFLREKFRPKGGPAGGDGGKGGDVILIATGSKHSLLDFKYKKHFKAQNGKPGGGKNKKGKDGEDLIIYVPLGTVVKDAKSGILLCDLTEEGQKCIIAKGGRGGKGNAHFATPINRTPRYAEPGEEGEERWVILELKLIADVGIIGLPNAGKSTLLTKLTRARVKTGSYPFTTVAPNLGVLQIDEENKITIADIPGLIENAHKGSGLGYEFLRHVERTKILLHLIDVSDNRQIDPLKAFEIVNKELKLYNPQLMEKTQIVVANKIDSLSDKDLLKELEKYFTAKGYDFIAISALSGENISKLKNLMWKVYREVSPRSPSFS